MAFIFIVLMAIIVIYLVTNYSNKEKKIEYVPSTPQPKQKETIIDALKIHPFVQESIKPEGKFYPKTLPFLQGKIETLTHDQKRACINQFVILEMEAAKQTAVSNAEAIGMACLIVGNWFGHGYDYISYLLYRAEETELLIDNIDSIADERTKEYLLCVSCEIAEFAKDKAKAIDLATTPFKVKNWSKAKVFELVRKAGADKNQGDVTESAEDYLNAFADYFQTPDSVEGWNMTITVNPDNRSELLYYKNNVQKNLVQPHCGVILQLVFAQSQEPQLWVLGTKGLQAYENGQFVDILKCYDGQDIVKGADNPMIDVADTVRGAIYGFYRNGEKVLIKLATTNSVQTI